MKYTSSLHLIISLVGLILLCSTDALASLSTNCPFLAFTATSAQEASFEFQMIDGSKVVGQPEVKFLKLDLGFGKLDIPIEKVNSFQRDQQSWIVTLTNGDRLTGKLIDAKFKVKLSTGELTLPKEQIKSCKLKGAKLPVVQTGALLVHFDFEAMRNGLVKNLGQDKFDLKLNSFPIEADSVFGKVLRCRGESRLTLGGRSDFQSKKFTVAAWMKPGGNRHNYAFICGKTDARNWSTGFGFCYLTNQPERITFFVNGYQGVVTNVEAPSNQWVHLVATWDGKILRLYRNGKLAQQSVFANGEGIQHASVPFTIGGDTEAYSWNGEIDEIRFYQDALLPKQVEKIWLDSKVKLASH